MNDAIDPAKASGGDVRVRQDFIVRIYVLNTAHIGWSNRWKKRWKKTHYIIPLYELYHIYRN
jgi:hypothetical protein